MPRSGGVGRVSANVAAAHVTPTGNGYRPRVDPEFRKLWAGQAVSVVGSNITLIALPLTAAITLSASAEEMGLLTAAGWLPILLFSLFAGAWADRLQRRPVLIVTDIARAVILATIPVAAVFGALTIAHVIVAAFLSGSMTVLFRSAYTPFIPALVGRERLVDANARLAMNESIGRVAGPSLGGLLVQVVTAPVAIAVDALSFVVSAVAIASIRVKESTVDRARRRSIWSEMADGMRVVARNVFIRSVTIIALVFNVAITTGETIFILYATRVLGLDGTLIGAVYTVGGLAAVAGTTVVQRTTARFGIGPSMVAAVFLVGIGWVLMLVAAGPPVVAATFLAARAALSAFGAAIFNVTTATVYQAAIPDRLQGRVGGAAQVLGLGLTPLAALGGGWLGEHIGLWNTLAVSLAGQLVGLVYVVGSPLRGIRTMADLALEESETRV